MSPVHARYHIRHDTLYRYDQPVGESRQLLRLSPRQLPWQQVVDHQIEVRPLPTRIETFDDAFGNPVRALHLEADHDELFVRAESWVDVFARPAIELEDSPPWESVRDGLAYRAGHFLDADTLQACGFLFESSHIRIKREFSDWAEACFTPQRPLLSATHALMLRIFEEFEFDPEATDVSTPVTEVFEHRRGVCQDFAHFMLSCLRSLGLAARYMSGYLLTRPPPGKPRLIGADATHAWVSVFCPGHGWIEFDPTNGIRPALEHITLGWGRDFNDVSPMRGVILGGGGHEPEIAVTVVPEDDFGSVYGDKLPLPALGQPILFALER